MPADDLEGSGHVAGDDTWVLESVEVEAQGAVRRGSRRGSRTKAPRAGADSQTDEVHVGADTPRATGPKNVATAGLFEGLGSAERTARLAGRLDEATRAYRRERYGDALKILRSLVRDASGVAEVRELTGLTYYQLGRWKDATRELSAFTEITGSTEQHPVLADCARASGRHGEVERLWNELRRAAPDADLVAEGRIVMAGSLADRGQIDEAVALMEKGRHRVKRPKERHLRMAYVLADLQERAGDLPAARAGFAWIRTHDPDFADVGSRLAALH